MFPVLNSGLMRAGGRTDACRRGGTRGMSPGILIVDKKIFDVDEPLSLDGAPRLPRARRYRCSTARPRRTTPLS